MRTVKQMQAAARWDTGMAKPKCDITQTTPNPHFDDAADLRQKSADLIAIVEGIKSVRWAHNGRRLKDTPEWAAFYVSANKANEKLTHD